MRRFFVDPAAVAGDAAALTGSEAHHLSEVLRLTPGTEVELFDGQGTIYRARVERLSRGRVELHVLAVTPPAGARPHLTLGVALLTGKKMDLVIQKATELGVDAILPYVSRHCSVKERNANKEERWQRIAVEACKQCNRPVPPHCPGVTDFATLIASARADRRIVFWEQEKRHTLADLLPAAAPPPASLIALFGPEGGFAGGEIDEAVAAGFTPVSLGRRILRAETAVISGGAILQYLLGNLAQG